MSTTVSYKGSTIATVDNNTKTLNTAGKYLEADVILTDVSQSGSTDFIITVSYNSTTQMWEPDKTFAEILAANTAGKTIVTKTTDGLNYGSNFIYVNSMQARYLVYARNGSGTYHGETRDTATRYVYVLRSTEQLTLLSDYTYVLPDSTLSINQNGTGIDVAAYASVDVAVPSTETNFIVTLSWDTAQQKWLPDCTMADLWGAFLAGKTISVSATDIPDVITADGFWSDDEVFVYFVHAYTTATAGIYATQWYAYVWTPSGITLHDDEIYIQPSGNLAITQNGTNIDVDQYSTVSVNVSGGTSKNAQVAQSTTRVTSTSLSACSGEITVAKTGTYDIYWATHRTSTSGNWSSQLYINSAASGTEQTGSWSNHVQPIHLSNVSLTQGQKVRVYAKSRGSNYYAYVPMLTIIES